MLLVLAAGAGALACAGCAARGMPAPFDAARAFEHLEAQCRLGPRVPGTPAHRAGRAYIEGEFRRHSKQVSVQEVRGRSGWGGDLAGWNIVARFGRGGAPLLVGAHWDSRARADLDPDPAKRLEPVPAANDGASGVAVLLELARLMGEVPPPRRVLLACFDLEDQGTETDLEAFCLGSKALAATWTRAPEGGEVIVLDMVGARGMELRREGYSMELARPLVDRLWSLAGALGAAGFIDTPGAWITDDHLPFLRRGWMAVDIIDTRYPEWHTTADLPEACDPKSLGAVGEVVRHYIYGLAPASR